MSIYLPHLSDIEEDSIMSLVTPHKATLSRANVHVQHVPFYRVESYRPNRPTPKPIDTLAVSCISVWWGVLLGLFVVLVLL